MDRAAGERLEASHYPFCCSVAIRYGDLDTQGHVNNIAMASLLEDARSRFLIEVGVSSICEGGGETITLGGGKLVTAAARYDYLAQAFYPGSLDVCCATTKVGRSSFSVAQLALQNGIPVAACSVVFALTDGRTSMDLGHLIQNALSGTWLQGVPA